MGRRGCECGVSSQPRLPMPRLDGTTEIIFSHFCFFMPPPREASRCGGGLAFVFATANERVMLFLPAKPGRTKAGTTLSKLKLRRRWRHGARAHSIPASRRRRAIAATSGLLIVRIYRPASPEMASPNRSAFPSQIASVLFVFYFSFFLSSSPFSMNGKFLKQKTHD